MRLLGTSSHSPIGVDIGTASIKAAQLHRGAGGWELRRAVNLSRAPESKHFTATEATLLADVLERQGFRGKEVVLAAPGAALMVDVLDLPPRDSGAPIDQLAAEEVARSHKLEPNTFCISVWDLPVGQRGSAGASAMSVALRHTDAETLLNPLEETGLTVTAIDSPAAALARVSRVGTPASAGIRAILDIGFSAATLMLAAGEGVIYQRRMTDAGLSALVASLLSEMHIGGEDSLHVLRELGVAETITHGPAASRVRGMVLRHLESLTGEIEAGLQYAKHRHPGIPFEELLLAGGGAAIRGADALLASRLEVTARPLHALGEHSTVDAIFAQAIGLALYGAA